MCAVTVEGTLIATSASGASEPPDAPVNAITRIPAALAARAAARMFGRSAARRDREEHVARRADRLDLSREHPVGPVVVGDRRQGRCVRGQRDRAHRRPRMVQRQRAHELRREVLRVGGAAAVAADEQRMAGSEPLDEQPCGSEHVIDAGGREGAHQIGGVVEVRQRTGASLVWIHLMPPVRRGWR